MLKKKCTTYKFPKVTRRSPKKLQIKEIFMNSKFFFFMHCKKGVICKGNLSVDEANKVTKKPKCDDNRSYFVFTNAYKIVSIFHLTKIYPVRVVISKE